MIRAALSDDDGEAMIRKAIEMAKAGNPQMLKLFLERLLPRERYVPVELPAMNFADDCVEAVGRIMQAVAEGRMTPAEAESMVKLVDSYMRAIDLVDVVKRLDALEASIRRDELDELSKASATTARGAS